MRNDEITSRREALAGLPGARRAETVQRPWSCLFTPSSAGQHHLPLELVRRDIAGDRPGVPLMLRVRVLDAATGDPVTAAVLDVRHRDATGETILRGAQVTDAEGYAEFRTVHPGWLPGRAVHLSAEVHVGGCLAGGRSVAHAGRLYVPEPVASQVAKLAPYCDIPAPRTSTDGKAGQLLVVPRDRFDVSAGLLATMAVGIGTPQA
ncbi:hypothetical protein AB0M02_13855 [Actinoplanes sp. NPDC051861]|uniref:hypothetical protein n=1 Tax=Actinoplanes sp. NPDC051861 TaxID=3155170 RepID=UPI0034202AFA